MMQQTGKETGTMTGKKKRFCMVVGGNYGVEDGKAYRAEYVGHVTGEGGETLCIGAFRSYKNLGVRRFQEFTVKMEDLAPLIELLNAAHKSTLSLASAER